MVVMSLLFRPSWTRDRGESSLVDSDVFLVPTISRELQRPLHGRRAARAGVVMDTVLRRYVAGQALLKESENAPCHSALLSRWATRRRDRVARCSRSRGLPRLRALRAPARSPSLRVLLAATPGSEP